MKLISLAVGGGLYGIAWGIIKIFIDFINYKQFFTTNQKLNIFFDVELEPLVSPFVMQVSEKVDLTLKFIVFNEIANGAVTRKLNKEQFFLSNTAAAILTLGGVHFFQSIIYLDKSNENRGYSKNGQ